MMTFSIHVMVCNICQYMELSNQSNVAFVKCFVACSFDLFVFYGKYVLEFLSKLNKFIVLCE